MPQRQKPSASAFIMASLKGGRNGIDPPTLVPDDQVLEALNVDWNAGALCRKRPGCDTVTLSGGTPVSPPICSLFRHLPAGSTDATAELWIVDHAGVFHRMAGGTTIADVTPKDAISATIDTNATTMRGVVFNGKLFLLYANASARVAVWDGTTLRRTGLAAPSGAPTNSLSAGAVTDTRNYYSAVVVKVAGVVTLRSELSAASGNVTLASQQATNTLVGTPGEGETHWELYAASTSDNVIHFVADAVIGNTIADNLATLTLRLAPLAGTNALIPDAVLAAKDGNSRMLFGRHRTVTSQTSRIWFSPILGSTGVGDDERIPAVVNQNNYFDLIPNDGDFLTALAGPLQGSMYAWKNRSTWKLGPTGDPNNPYTLYQLSGIVGCVCDKSVVQGTDEYGLPTLYWMSLQGPYRFGSQGMQYMGRDIEDIWITMNLTANIPCHGVFYPQLHQVWWWMTVSTNTDPTVLVVFDTILGRASLTVVGDAPPSAGVRRGWAKWTGDLASARCSVMFARSIGASMGILQRPYAGFSAAVGTPRLLGADSATATDDGGTTFQSYIQTKPYQPVGRNAYFESTQPSLQAKASSGVTIQCKLTPNYLALPFVQDTVTLTPVNNETRVWRKFQKLALPRCQTMQIQLGDAMATGASWELDQFVMPLVGDGVL